MDSPSVVNRAVSLTNRCAESKSPYVRSHINNPTAWQLWTPETLDLARKTNRLLFVSIGYSACHWCHVMAHESFDDPRIAQLLNEQFIPVKIDREERPDIDRQYMDFQQATSGGGGWPLNVFVTPELEPIFGGTYWPGPNSDRSKTGVTTFDQILQKVAQTWKEQEARCRESGKQITAQLREFAQEGLLGGPVDGKVGSDLELDIIDDAFQHFKDRYDPAHGGFGGAPKFPTPINVRALLRLSAHSQEVRAIVGEDECAFARTMAMKTLESMAKGAIKDQIGHGFARYSVTPDWSLPHFEKMLYDNAQLLPLYLDAWLLTGSSLFLEMVHDIATYLTSGPMVSTLGGINASEDADSLPNTNATEKSEGAYYVWTVQEFKSILGEQEFTVCTKYWNVQPSGNIDPRLDAQGELAGQNTLSVQCDPAELAEQLGMPENEIKRIIAEGRQKLVQFREKNRPRPALDDKIVTAWNGLAIGGLARASAALLTSSPDKAKLYLEGALKAVTFIQTQLYHASTGNLRRIYREGPSETLGFADDYAFLISGLIDLYETTFDSSWLEFADKLQETQIRLFWDEQNSGFFSTPSNQPDILIRSKDAMDNAEPSTNGVSAANLFRLASLFNDEKYDSLAKKTVATFEVEIGQHPGLFTGLLSSVVASKLGMKGIMVVGEGQAATAALQKARQSTRPNVTILRIGGGVNSEWLRSRNSLLSSLDANKEMVQLCEGGVCKLLDASDIDGMLMVPESK